MIFYSCIPLLKNTFKTLIHFPNKNLMTKKKNILKQFEEEIKTNKNNFVLENFKIWQIKNNYIIVEIKILIHKNLKDNQLNIDDKDNINTEKYNQICMDIQNQIINIIENNKINEYYIEIF